jgi:serine/threonine protein kinase
MLDIEQFIQTDELFDGHYRLLRPLSTDGGSADVWLALDTNTIDDYPYNEDGVNALDESTGLLVAIKIYRPKNALDIEGQQRFRDEYKIVHECRHTNLLQPTTFSIFKGTPYLVLPYCEAGSSEQFIGKKLSSESVWKFILEVASGLDRLHSNHPQIIHQDIKPANILIDSNGNFTITDFGISTKRSDGYDSYYEDENSGTLAYMAPERFEDNAEPSSQSDIWAFGATLCEILTGSLPFGEEGGKAQAEGLGFAPTLKGLPRSIQNLILACLQLEPEKRPTAHEIVKAAQKRRFGIRRDKNLILYLACGILILLVAIIFILIPKPKNGPQGEKVVNDYNQAVQLLLDPSNAKKGWRILDSLAFKENDFDAIFLMSRLYFAPSEDQDKENERIFYNPEWKNMRDYASINTDYKKAHDLLCKAYSINENNCALLYELGCDYMSFERGCDQNYNYAKWCLIQAREAASTTQNEKAEEYLKVIDCLDFDAEPEKPEELKSSNEIK